MFVKVFVDDDFFIIILYIDNMMIIGQNSEMINKLKNEINKYFPVKYLRLV